MKSSHFRKYDPDNVLEMKCNLFKEIKQNNLPLYFYEIPFMCLIRAVYGRSPIKFILPEFVSLSGERGVLCVGNGSHFCTLVLMNMCNITFKVLRLSTFVSNKCSEKKNIFTILFVVNMVKSLRGFGWNNVGPASQTVVQHYISIGPMYGVIWCLWRRDVKVLPA